MPKPRRSSVLPFAALLLAAAATPSAAQTWVIDGAHSDMSFRVKHLVISRVLGKFDKFEGSVTGDPKSPAAAKVELKIQTASINTGEPKRDDHLRSADFFDAARFPEITFTSTKIEEKGGGSYAVTGDLTMHGVTKPVTLDVKNLGFVKDQRGNERAGFEVTGRINRQDWGVSWSKKLDTGGLVADDMIDLTINVELVQKKPEPPKA